MRFRAPPPQNVMNEKCLRSQAPNASRLYTILVVIISLLVGYGSRDLSHMTSTWPKGSASNSDSAYYALIGLCRGVQLKIEP